LYKKQSLSALLFLEIFSHAVALQVAPVLVTSVKVLIIIVDFGFVAYVSDFLKGLALFVCIVSCKLLGILFNPFCKLLIAELVLVFDFKFVLFFTDSSKCIARKT
jgi:hypothetical protein